MSTETIYFKINKGRVASKHLIVVEGSDDAIFISEILKSIKANPDDVGIIDVGGNVNFDRDLRNYFKSSSYFEGKNKTLSIICDADDDHNETVERINTTLSSLGQPTLNAGEIKKANGIHIGLFVMPNCAGSGDLEKLCLMTVENSPLAQEAIKFIETAKKQSGGVLTGSIFKRQAQVYLAGMNGSLVRGAGHGYKDGHFQRDHPSLGPLINFLEQVIRIA